MQTMQTSLLLELNKQELNQKVRISPIGEVTGIDGRKFKIDGEKIIQIIKKNGVDLALNLNHQGGEAYGWFDCNSLELRDDGIYANLELTPKGKELVDSKAFRYLSPEYYTDKDKNVVFLEAMGLVNQPNLLNKALNMIKKFYKQRNAMTEEELEELSALADEVEKKAEAVEDKAEDVEDNPQNPNSELETLKKENEELKAKVNELSKKLEEALNQSEEALMEFNKKRLNTLLQNGEILPSRYQKALNMKGKVLEEYLDVCKEEARVILSKKELKLSKNKKEFNELELKVFKQLGIKGDK